MGFDWPCTLMARSVDDVESRDSPDIREATQKRMRGDRLRARQRDFNGLFELLENLSVGDAIGPLEIVAAVAAVFQQPTTLMLLAHQCYIKLLRNARTPANRNGRQCVCVCV